MRPVLTGLLLVLLAGLPAGAAEPGTPGVIWLVRDLSVPSALASESADRLDQPMAPGSVMKIATLAAALEAGIITPASSLACTRHAQVAGRDLRCTHPDLHRPLRAEDVLGYSCNSVAATLAGRLPRAALEKVLLDLGLPPATAGAPVAGVGLGVEGLRVSPRRLADMMARVVSEPSPLPWKPSTLATIRAGLALAARSGTAAALAGRGLSDVFAKTGTTVVEGRSLGVVVGSASLARRSDAAASTPRRVVFVLVASGAAGLDAASLAADRLTRLAATTSAQASPATAARSVPSAAAPHEIALAVGVPNTSGRRGRDGYDVRRLSLDDYVAGVVAGEAAAGASRPALDALAITVRSYALANRGRHRDDGFDLCTLTHCQVLRPATAQTTAAAMATAGQVLLSRGRPASVFLSASCGGRSARPSEVWSGAIDEPFLPGQDDDACADEPTWQADIPVGDLMRALRATGMHGDLLRGVRIVARSASGRVRRLQLDGFVPAEMSGEEFRSRLGRTLGWNHLKSTAFDVQQTGAGFHFSGRGAGHGVGLCVIGATRRAARGESAQAILARYFPGLSIGRTGAADTSTTTSDVATTDVTTDVTTHTATTPQLAPRRVSPRPVATRVNVIVPLEEQPEQEPLRALALRALSDLTARLGVAPPSRVTLRFHPTVESYQRATGRQWFTSGATTADGQAHFIPLSALKSRGMVDDTVRHELVHLLTATAYRDRLVWVQEGAAAYFALTDAQRHAFEEDRRPTRASTSAASCPTNAELLRPASRDALRQAYMRATACYAEQLKGGRGWRDVR